ncbi:MAG: hypothetical protein GVY08_06380 [Bacteroidetes bacterium]|jgi:hypothetical protein|nr:hypothetical protein [Bacteroidota bacterium]
MKKKLTLTIEKEVTERAKILARREGTSISQWVEDLLKEKTAQAQRTWTPEPDSWTEKMLGSVSLPDDTDYKALKEEEILKKYGQ